MAMPEKSVRSQQRRAHLRVVGESESGQRLPNPSKAIHALPDEYLECRTEGHDWEILGQVLQAGIVTKIKKCRRCTKERRARYRKSNGMYLDNNYTDPEGYALKGFGHIDRAKVRVEQFKRVEFFSSEDDLMAFLTSAAAPTRRSSKK